MATVELNSDNFMETIENNELVFIDFWADWCQPCQAFGPIYEYISEMNSDIIFGKVDIDANQELASAAEIQAVPTLMVTKHGEIIYMGAGGLTSSELDDLVDQARETVVSEDE